MLKWRQNKTNNNDPDKFRNCNVLKFSFCQVKKKKKKLNTDTQHVRIGRKKSKS